MSVIIFELKKEHLLLLKNLSWSLNSNKIIQGVKDEIDEIAPPFGANSIYEGIDLILNGRPEDFKPFETEEEKEYSDEQKAEWDQLYKELATAMEIIFTTKDFVLGKYKTLSYNRDWKYIKN